jgi:hypothetical protein
MSRFIEVRQVESCPAHLMVRVGDVLLFQASGGRVRHGAQAVELWGPFFPAFVSPTGEVVAPAGSPNGVLLRAGAPGSATLDLFTGDPWHATRTTSAGITVES